MLVRRVHWLASYPKSGNTWARLFVQAYSDGYLDINKLNVTITDIKVSEYQNCASLPIDKFEPGAAVFFRPGALLNQAATSTKNPTIFKTHNRNEAVNGITLIPKELTKSAVYLVRDPRDMVISISKHMGKTIDESIDLINYNDYGLNREESNVVHFVGSWSNHVRSWLEDDRFPVTIVRYEDMLLNPVESFSRILTGLNLAVEEERVKNALKLCEFSRVKKQEENDGFMEKSDFQDSFFSKGTSGYWKEILTSEQEEKLISHHEDMMIEMGYLDSRQQLLFA